MSNQCMGCQAGWPVRRGSHVVRGGYPHETVACTAARYGTTTSARCGEAEEETRRGPFDPQVAREIVRRLFKS